MTDNQVSLTAKIDTYLHTLLAAEQFSGVVLQAIGDEIILERGYGLADRELEITHTAETVFPIGSLTKPFTAMAVLILVAHKQLDLAERIRVYLPECPPHWEAITAHHLLSHTAGLPNVTAFQTWISPVCCPRPTGQWLSSPVHSRLTLLLVRAGLIATPVICCWGR